MYLLQDTGGLWEGSSLYWFTPSMVFLVRPQLFVWRRLTFVPYEVGLVPAVAGKEAFASSDYLQRHLHLIRDNAQPRFALERMNRPWWPETWRSRSGRLRQDLWYISWIWLHRLLQYSTWLWLLYEVFRGRMRLSCLDAGVSLRKPF